MGMDTHQSLSGFIASTPKLSRTEKGDAKFYARIGKEHFTRQADGTFLRGPTTFHDLVVFRTSAERAYTQFAKGDCFIAEGYTHTFTRPGPDGQTVQSEQFVAKKIGHDMARTNYTINRAPTTPAPVQDPPRRPIPQPVPTGPGL